MCKTFDKAKTVIDEYIAKKEPFTYLELQKSIIHEGGVLRIAPGVTIGSYLRKLEDRRIIFYNEHSEKFDFIEHVEKLEVNNFEKLTRFNLAT